MWLTNLRLVLPEVVLARGALLVEGDRIAEVVEGDAPGRSNGARRVVDCRGLTALPGVIDLHGDMVERELEPRPGAIFPAELAIHELDKRLAACGVTTAYAALSFWDGRRDEAARHQERVRQLTQTINRMRGALLVDHMIHARYEVTTPSMALVLRELLGAGEIHMLSLMDHTPGQGQYRNLERYVDYLARHRGAEHDVVARETEERMRRALDGSAAYWEQAQELVELAAGQGLPIASHDDDTPDKVDLVARLGATIAEFPVAMEAAEEARRREMHVVMGAPNVLRGGSHSGNLSAVEAIEAGVVDTLAADYYPAALLQAVFLIERRGLLPLHAAARLVGQNAADALGLHDRGRLAAGRRADIALVEVAETPRVRGVLRGGRPIYWDGYVG
jgi:alpha-D-ribose 1-methylphosphonate 5-triphosphate diphosphatase